MSRKRKKPLGLPGVRVFQLVEAAGIEKKSQVIDVSDVSLTTSQQNRASPEHPTTIEAEFSETLPHSDDISAHACSIPAHQNYAHSMHLNDRDLAEIVNAWATLPAEMRTTILLMVRSLVSHVSKSE